LNKNTLNRAYQSEKKIQTVARTFEGKGAIQGKNLGPIFQFSNENHSLNQLLTENESPKFMGNHHQLSQLNYIPEREKFNEISPSSKAVRKEPLREIKNTNYDSQSKEGTKRENQRKNSLSCLRKEEKQDTQPKTKKIREAKERKKFFSIGGSQYNFSKQEVQKKIPSYLKNVQSKIKDEVRMTREMLQQQMCQQNQNQYNNFYSDNEYQSRNSEMRRRPNMEYVCYQEEEIDDDKHSNKSLENSREENKDQVSYALSGIPRRDSNSTSPISRQSNLFRRGEDISIINQLPNFEKYELDAENRYQADMSEYGQNNYINVNNYIQNPSQVRPSVLSPQHGSNGNQRIPKYK
jgi:hypothetical protein